MADGASGGYVHASADPGNRRDFMVWLIVAIVEALIIVGLGIVFYIDKRGIRIMLQNASEIANKNVEVDDIQIRGSKNSKALAESINLLKKNMLAFIESTKGNVIVLSDAIDLLSQATKANEAGSEQTNESICVVAQKAAEQLELVKNNLDLIEENDRQLEIIDSSMQTTKRTLNESTESCSDGMTRLEHYETDMNRIAGSLKQSRDILSEFNEKIDEVNTLGDLVVSVSEDMSLLALNASIEAARAGENGKGFAVVAQQMAVMSEKTKENMDAITDILKKVIDSSKQVNDIILACNDTFEASSEVFQGVSTSFRRINTQSQKINSMMSDMIAKHSVIADNSNASREKAENVFSASGVISNNTQEIVSISQETSAQSAQMTENVASLEQMLVSLRKLVKQFKTGVVPVEKNPSRTLKIAFFSKLDNYFWYAIRRGVLYAKKELAQNNVEIIYYPYEDDIQESQFPVDVKKCINEKVDAIIYPGFINKADRELAQAVSAGVRIFTYNCDCPKYIKRISCYEPDQREAGEMAAKAVAKTLNRKGNVAIVLGDRQASVNADRYDSFVNYVRTNYKELRIVDTIEVTYNAEKTYQQVVELIRKNPELQAIYSTTGMQIQLAKAIEDTGNTGKIRAVVFDQNDEIFQYIRKGVIAAAIDHDPFSQGHDPIIYMYNHLVAGVSLPETRIKCKASVVDFDNVNERVSVE